MTVVLELMGDINININGWQYNENVNTPLHSAYFTLFFPWPQMSFKPEDVATNDISDLTEKELKILDDWETKLAKKYPTVGTLKK